MEEHKSFMEKRKGFLGGLYGGGECPGKADYVKDMISGGEKDDRTTLDAHGRATRSIRNNMSDKHLGRDIDKQRREDENIIQCASRIWNINTPTLDNEESGSCEFDRDGGM